MGGHVFVVRGDITKLACDAWLLPTDEGLRVDRLWVENRPELADRHDGHRIGVDRPPDWGSNGVRTVPIPAGLDAISTAWLTNVGASESTPTAWYVDGARQYLDGAATSLAGARARRGRERPLLALPLVGTRFGGARRAGEVVRQLLPELYGCAARHGVDVVLVTYRAEHFAAAQHERARCPEAAALPDRLETLVDRLREAALQQRLVLFLGAGVSASAGLPLWPELLDRLGRAVDCTDDELELLRRLNPLDAARIIGRRAGAASMDLGRLIAGEFDIDTYGLSHALLASLPVTEVVTTNYDRCFEMASDDAGRPLAVLPYEASQPHQRWLLKLHGSVNQSEDIVLTREDYLRYSDRRGALAGIVQALLITRHMLFIGFSMTDDNFHGIVDDVRKAVRGERRSGHEPFGTAITLTADSIMAELWRDDLACESITDDDDVPRASRLLEVMLDTLALRLPPDRQYLMNSRFASVLDEEEETLRDALEELSRKVPAHDESGLWIPIRELLMRFGNSQG